MKIRNSFVSNSSSSSFIVIGRTKHITDRLVSAYQNTDLVVDENFGTTEFGWDRCEYDSFGDRVIFSFIQAKLLDDMEKTTKHMDMLEKVLIDNLKLSSITWKLSVEWDISEEQKKQGITHCYIDHQSSAEEGENTDMFNGEDYLYDFLFSNESYIQGDNDNY